MKRGDRVIAAARSGAVAARSGAVAGRSGAVAARSGAVATLRALLSDEESGPCRAKDAAGRTSLHWAVANGHVEALVCAGADAEARCAEGRSPLQLATDARIARLLLRGVPEAERSVFAVAAAGDAVGLARHLAEPGAARTADELGRREAVARGGAVRRASGGVMQRRCSGAPG
jgi:hypothetical protein